MKTLDQQINEVLSQDATAGDWIHDFVHSDNPKFAGKTKEKRKEMALAAYYAKQQNEEVESIEELETKTLKSYINKNIRTGRADSDKGDSGLYRATKKVASTLSTSTLDKKVNKLGYTSSSDNKNKYEYGASRSELKNRGIHYFAGRRTRTEEVELEENTPVAPVPDRKYIKGTPENLALKASRKPINGHPTNKIKEGSMKSFKELLQSLPLQEAETIEERNKENAMMRKTMDASRGAKFKLNNPVPDADPKHKTARDHNVAIGRALRNEEKKDDVPFDGPYTKSPGTVKDKSGAVHTPMSRELSPNF